jgi:RNA polymerase sigma-70 factor (ECF subfamily)
VAKKPENAEARFGRVFQNYGIVVGFAKRRGGSDPESIAAEVMSIAWDRLDQLDASDCRSWLLATARNLLYREYRGQLDEPVDPASLDDAQAFTPDYDVNSLDPEIDRALAALDPLDRETLILVSWDELTPKEAAASLGIKPSAFRVRLHRARQRFVAQLQKPEPNSNQTTPHLREERT